MTIKNLLISEKYVLTSARHCLSIYRKYRSEQDVILLFIFAELGKLKYSKNYLLNRIYVFLLRARKLLAQITNDFIEDTKELIRASLYNGNKKWSFANYTKSLNKSPH